MNNFDIVFSRPWLLLSMIPALAIILIPFLLLPRRRRSTLKRILPVVLHSVICTLLILCLAGISFIIGTNEQTVMILMDLSDSTEQSHGQIVDYANGIIEAIDGDCGVVAFAGNAVYSVEIDQTLKSAHLVEVLAGDTDIAAALEFAADRLPSDTNRRVILLSDGKQTSGNASAAASALASRGYRIDAVYFESSYLGSAEMQISEIEVPSDIYDGDTVDILVTVESNAAAEAELVLYDGESEVARMAVGIAEGSNSYSISAVANGAGVHTYSATIETSSDVIAQNNTMYSYVNIAGESGILVIADNVNKIDALKEILDPACELTVVTPQGAPDSIIDLCNYDEIILVNVDANELPRGFADLLSSYVSEFGRSLLTVGGDGTYMYGNMADTVLEEMMPVELHLNESSGGSVALMLVLDCSSSMSRTGTYLSTAKQSAILSVEAMSDNDYVGVISFNRSAYLKSSLLPATDANKQQLNRVISGLNTSQGTYYTEALELAHRELLKSDAPTKHVIFLSDGEPSDRGYATAVQNMADDGITVSTIALGYSSSVLSQLANIGGGRYYAVTHASDLPDIMLSETEEVAVSSLIEGEFIPIVAEESNLTEGLEITALPTLYGYLGVTVKEDASSVITTTDGNPIYAVWQYGIGRVASFMSDLEGEWSADWLSDELGRILIERMMTTTVGNAHSNSSISAGFDQVGIKTTVTAECVKTDAGDTVSLTVGMPDGDTRTYSLTEVRPGVYECEIDTSAVGVYQTMIIQYDSEGNALDYLDTALAVSYSEEYNAFSEPGDGLLSAICSYSDGIVTSDISRLAEIKMDSVEIVKDPMIPLALICAALMLADLIIRLLRVKDVKEFLRRFTSHK